MATWEVELPPDQREAGEPGHADDHNALTAALKEVREGVDAAEKTATWGGVKNRPSTYPPADHDHQIEADEDSGLAGGSLQEALEALSARVKLLEQAASEG